MLTAAEVAAQLGIKPRTVYDIDPAELPRFQIGGAVRYEQADVTEYKAKCRSIVTKRRVAGALSSTVSFRERGASELESDFRSHGVEPRLIPLTSRKRGDCARSQPESKSLSLVSSKQ